MKMSQTVQIVIVALIGIVALAFIVKKVRSAMTGQCSCGCGGKKGKGGCGCGCGGVVMDPHHEEHKH